jgi:hypothetical protein
MRIGQGSQRGSWAPIRDVTDAISVSVRDAATAAWNVTIAILVHTIAADLRGIRVGCAPAVVAIRVVHDMARRRAACLDRDGRVAVPVAVRIGVECRLRALIDIAVAVVVLAVAVLSTTRMHVSLRIIAIRAVHHITRRQNACLGRNGRVAVPVAVSIGIECRLHTFINGTVAVVVFTVAALTMTRMPVCIRVVTVRIFHYIARRRAAFLDRDG